MNVPHLPHLPHRRRLPDCRLDFMVTGVQLWIVSPIIHMEDIKTISPKSRRWLCFAAWVVAVVAMVIPDPRDAPLGILFAWTFPLGIFRLIFSPDERFGEAFGVAILIGGWLFYGYLTILTLSQSRKGRFIIIYAVLCIILALNVVGCNKMANDPMQDSL
jgi:hypothetical protein